jgi:hypothetical protein
MSQELLKMSPMHYSRACPHTISSQLVRIQVESRIVREAGCGVVEEEEAGHEEVKAEKLKC